MENTSGGESDEFIIVDFSAVGNLGVRLLYCATVIETLCDDPKISGNGRNTN